jgi:hypothetical protein
VYNFLAMEIQDWPKFGQELGYLAGRASLQLNLHHDFWRADRENAE